VVNELRINDDTRHGGVAPRYDEYGYWSPPTCGAGFGPSHQGRFYRWSNGVITPVEGSTQPGSDYLTLYKAASVFYCNPFHQFFAAMGDVSIRDMETAEPLHDRWYRLRFRYDEAFPLSRLDIGGSEEYLVGANTNWVSQLGLSSYVSTDPSPPMAHGLSGDLTLLIALIAFSCEPRYFDRILIQDRAWHRCHWRGHNRHHGRKEYDAYKCQ
jgi:hypothetical protein